VGGVFLFLSVCVWVYTHTEISLEINASADVDKDESRTTRESDSDSRIHSSRRESIDQSSRRGVASTGTDGPATHRVVRRCVRVRRSSRSRRRVPVPGKRLKSTDALNSRGERLGGATSKKRSSRLFVWKTRAFGVRRRIGRDSGSGFGSAGDARPVATLG
jgi:hypothetical protein